MDKSSVYVYIVDSEPGHVACSITESSSGLYKLQIDTGSTYGPYKREFRTLKELFRTCRHLFPTGQLALFKRAALRHGQVANAEAIERGVRGNPKPSIFSSYTNQAQIRAAFWAMFPHFEEQARAAGIFSKGQNHHCATVRCCFVEFVDDLARDGMISEKLANRVTL